MPEVSAYVVLRVVMGASAIATLFGCAEWLYLHRQFRDTGIYAWRVQRFGVRRVAAPAGLLFAYPQVLAIPAVQMLLSALLLVPGLPLQVAGGCALGVALGSFLLSYRGVDGFGGGDKMAAIVLLAGGIALVAGSERVIAGALVFVTGLMLIAYSTPGWHRIFDRSWHDATKLKGVMRTETYGRRALWRLFEDQPLFARFVASSIACWEAFFVLYLFLPIPLLLMALSIGVVFHFSNAFVMRLNIFPFSFPGNYPAVIWTAVQLQSHLFGKPLFL